MINPGGPERETSVAVHYTSTASRHCKSRASPLSGVDIYIYSIYLLLLYLHLLWLSLQTFNQPSFHVTAFISVIAMADCLAACCLPAPFRPRWKTVDLQSLMMINGLGMAQAVKLAGELPTADSTMTGMPCAAADTVVNIHQPQAVSLVLLRASAKWECCGERPEAVSCCEQATTT